MQTPVVATSGNRSEEPIVTDEHEALIRLTGLADAFLVHGRPISRPVDDSVVRIVNGKVMMLRRARGYVPAPINLNVPGVEGKHRPSLLALGGHLKNTVAVTTQDHVIVSQHIGNLSTPEACAQFERTIADYLILFDVKPQAIACDLHPDYRSTIHAYQLGRTMNLPVIPVQHHYAHILSCMAEHRLAAPVLGIAWDGAGYGTDGTLWGGEFLLADYSDFTRVGHLKPYRLPGGEICMREPRRVALSLLYETFGEACLEMDVPPIRSLGSHLAAALIELLKKDVNCPVTTSMGRLFDGISSILGLCHINTFEGEAALALEFAAERFFTPSRPEGYSLPFTTLYPQKRGRGKGFHPASMPFNVNWEPLVRSIVKETMDKHPSGKIGMKFHQALANMIVDARNMFSSHKIVLSGGVFQNSLLNQSIHANLREKDFVMHTHHYFPSHDGGIALGQATHSIFRTSLSSLAI